MKESLLPKSLSDHVHSSIDRENSVNKILIREDSRGWKGHNASINYTSIQEEEGTTSLSKILFASKHALAVICICGIIASQLGSAYVDKSVLNNDSYNFNKPYFMVWFNISWNMFCAILSLDLWKHIIHHFKTGTPSPLKRLIKPALALSFLWVAESWFYFLGVNNLSVSLSLLFSQSSTVWCFFFSFLILKSPFTSARVLALLFCATGVVLTVVDNWTGAQSTIDAIIYSLFAAAGWGLYEVLFKRFLGDATLLEVNAFLGLVGFFDLFILWFPMIILNATGWETFALPSKEAWSGLALGATLTLTMHFLLNAANALSNPLFVRIGATVATPVSILIDRILGYEPGPYCYIGTALILIAFLFINVPEEMSFQWDIIIGFRKDSDEKPMAPKPLRDISASNPSFSSSEPSLRTISDSTFSDP